MSSGGARVAAVNELPHCCLKATRPSRPHRGSLEFMRRNSSETLTLASSQEGSTRPRLRALHCAQRQQGASSMLDAAEQQAIAVFEPAGAARPVDISQRQLQLRKQEHVEHARGRAEWKGELAHEASEHRDQAKSFLALHGPAAVKADMKPQVANGMVVSQVAAGGHQGTRRAARGLLVRVACHRLCVPLPRT